MKRWLFWLGEELDDYRIARQVFVRGLGFVLLIAFVSLWVQFDGLYGNDGILPLAFACDAVREQFRPSLLWSAPSLFWISGSSGFVHGVFAAGCVGALLLAVGRFAGPALLLSLVCYGSFGGVWPILRAVYGSPGFLSFQWDALLLEASFLGLWVVSWGPRLSPRGPRRGAWWLLWFLLFRLMVASGIVKLLVDDPSQEDGNVWLALTALDYHYWTQPLPTTIGWFATRLPTSAHQFSTVVMFAIELVVPFAMLGPRIARLWAALLLILLQILIAATGNYGFFNLLTVVLCLTWLDNRAWPKRWPWLNASRKSPEDVTLGIESPGNPRRPWREALVAWSSPWLLYFAAAFFLLSLSARAPTGSRAEPSSWQAVARAVQPPGMLGKVSDALQGLSFLNSYGLFARMTVQRPELIIEHSPDGAAWIPYEFRDKPGDLDSPPRWVQPHMPRLDWQMWFEALRGPAGPSPWFRRFLEGLGEGRPAVTDLLSPGTAPTDPPHQIRVIRWQYQPTGRAGREASTDLEEEGEFGEWWARRDPRLYATWSAE